MTPRPVTAVSLEDRRFSRTALAVLIAISTFIAYPSLGYLPKVFLSSILLFFVLLLAIHPLPLRESPNKPLFPVGRPGILFAILLIAGLLARFWNVTGYSAWPLYDEGIHGLYALDNIEGWDGRFHYFYSSLPPLFIWIQALFFRFLGPSPFSLWLFPALLVAGAWGLTAATASRLGGMNAFLGVLAWTALGYWSLLPGRHSHPYVLLLFWECLCGFLTVFISTSGRWGRTGWMLLLGICLGAGFLTFFSWSWIVPAVLVAALLAYRHRLKDASIRRSIPWLVGIPLLFLVPLLILAFRGAYRGHLMNMLTLPADPYDFLARFSYLAAFATNPVDSFRYGPAWGGLLNPIELAFFLSGLADSFRRRKDPGHLFMLLLFPLLLLPVFLTSGVNFTRLAHLQPLTCFFLYRGLRVLGATTQRPTYALVFLLVLSSGLNLFHLWGPARAWATDPQRWEGQRRIEDLYTFRLLQDHARDHGMGMLFLRLDTSDPVSFSSMNPSLQVLSRPWNILSKPGTQLDHAVWAAFLTDDDLYPLLKGLSPDCRRIPLPSSTDGSDRPKGIAIFSMDQIDRGRLNRLLAAESFLQHLYRTRLEDMDLGASPASVRKRHLEDLVANRRLFEGDAFLREVYRRVTSDPRN